MPLPVDRFIIIIKEREWNTHLLTEWIIVGRFSDWNQLTGGDALPVPEWPSRHLPAGPRTSRPGPRTSPPGPRDVAPCTASWSPAHLSKARDCPFIIRQQNRGTFWWLIALTQFFRIRIASCSVGIPHFEIYIAWRVYGWKYYVVK